MPVTACIDDALYYGLVTKLSYLTGGAGVA
jgi:hypothetical protein